MKRAGRLLVVIVATAIALIAVPIPAQAVTVQTAVPAQAGTVEVTGEPWSAPAQPVKCVRNGSQVSCAPTSASERTSPQCFLGVRSAAGPVTVCTTYSGNTAALMSASRSGKKAELQYGCQFGDAICAGVESYGRGMAAQSATAMLGVTAVSGFDTNSMLWDAATGEWSFWAWAVLGVMLIALIWGLASAGVQGSRDEVVGVIGRTFGAVLAIPLSLWLTGHVLNIVDELSVYVLTRGDGLDGLWQEFQRVMFLGGSGDIWWMTAVVSVVSLAMVLLILVFSFRNLALAALIMVGPIAWMLFPVKQIGTQWVIRYFSAMGALLLTGPLTLGLLKLSMTGLGNLESLWDFQAIPFVMGLLLIAFAPFAVFGLFSFAGGAAVDALGASAGRGAGRAATSVGRSAAGAAKGAGRAAGAPLPRLGGARGGAASKGAGAVAAGPSAARSSAAKPTGSSPATPRPTAPAGASTPSTSTPATPQPPRRSDR